MFSPRRNITLLFLIKGLRWFMVMIPILVLFYRDLGLSMQQVFLTQAIFSFIMVIGQVPTGYFADVVGRKPSIIIGTTLSALGFIVYSFAYGFNMILIAEILLGFGSSFISGADSALLYDTLVEAKSQENYKKMEGRITSIGNFAEGIASIIGGVLATISLRFPIYLQTIIMIVALPLPYFLYEVKHHRTQIKGHLRNMLRIINYSVRENKQIKWLIIYSAILSTTTLNFIWFIQPYWQNVGLPLALFGISWAALQFSVAFFSLISHRTEKVLGDSKTLILMCVLAALGYFGLGTVQSLWGSLFMLIIYFVWGTNGPVLKGYVNKLIPTEMRATVLSLKEMGTRLLFVVVGPLAGWLADIYSFSTALILSGVIFLILGCFALIFLRKYEII